MRLRRAARAAIRGLGLALATTVAACSPQTSSSATISQVTRAPQTEAAVHPRSGLPVIPLTIEHGGRTHMFRVEVARTSIEQSRGLMFRTEMGPDEGMIFPMDPPRLASFWMRNTVISLDLLFIGSDNRVLNIAANARPYDEKPLTSNGLVKAVLELNGGRAAQLGIAPGDLVRW